MSTTGRRLLRLFAVAALVGATLVPAVVAQALPTPENTKCDGIAYDSSNPNHHLAIGGTTLNLKRATEGQVVFMASAIVGPGVTVIGSPFDDIICGTLGTDVLKGKGGNDRIFGDGSAAGLGDDIRGGVGDDVLVNGSDATGFFVTPFAGTAATMRAGAGDDFVYFGTGADVAFGNAGADLIAPYPFAPAAGAGAFLSGNNGDDTIVLSSGLMTTGWGGKGADSLTAGTGPGQWLTGGEGDDTLGGLGAGLGQVGDGGPGNDAVRGAATGANLWFGFGGAGNDAVTAGALSAATVWLYGDYSAAGTPAECAVWTTAVTGPGAYWDGTTCDALPVNNVAGGDDVITGTGGTTFGWGGPANDRIFGGSLGDFLAGEGGDDYIEGGAGGDIIFGGNGNDTMYGNYQSVSDMDAADNFTDLMDGGNGSDDAFGQIYSGACPGTADVAGDTGVGATDWDRSWGTVNAPTIEEANDPC